MQRAKYNQQLASMDRRQRMISDASVERSRISAGADRYKARLDQGKDMYDSYVDMQKAGMDRDADLLRESVNILNIMNEFDKRNPMEIAKKDKDGYYIMSKDGLTKIRISEKEKMDMDIRNERINSLYDLMLKGYGSIKGTNVNDLNPDQLTSEQIKALAKRTGGSSNFEFKNGQMVTKDGRTMPELANDYLDSQGDPREFNPSPDPVPVDTEQKAGALKDLMNTKGGQKAGANQGVNTGKGFREQVKQRGFGSGRMY